MDVGEKASHKISPPDNRETMITNQMVMGAYDAILGFDWLKAHNF